MARRESQGLSERDRTQVLHVESAGHGDDAARAIGLTHRFVEQGRNDASMGMARRTGETAGEPEPADDVLAGVRKKTEAEPGGVAQSTAKAVVQRAVREWRKVGLVT